jgi:hypothetical protein
MGGRTKTWALVLLLLAVAGLALVNLYNVTREAPKFSELVARDAVLRSPVEVESGSRRSIRGRFAIFMLDGGRATVEELCDVWECRLPDNVKALQAGDHVTMWIAGRRIWQLNHDGELLLDYQQAVDAHHRASLRKETVVGFLTVAMLLALVFVFVRRRRVGTDTRAPLSVTARRVRATVKWSFKVDKRVDVGMLAHTKTLSGPALDRFQEAAKRRDRPAMIAALVEAGLSEASAGHAADALLDDSRKLPG